MRLWPFSTRGARIDTEESLPPLDLTTLDFNLFRSNDACLKLWLPEKLTTTLDRMSTVHESSRPDVLRRLFFEHVYGIEVFMALVAWKKQQDDETLKARSVVMNKVFEIKRSTRRTNIETFGKATEDFKFWLPSPLKRELQILSKTSQLGVSDYLRKTLVRLLFGERAYMNWQMAIGAIPVEWLEIESNDLH